MKKKTSLKIIFITLLMALLFASCKHDAGKGHLLRVIVYYPCSGYFSNMMYPSAPQKEDYGIYQVLVKIKNDTLTTEMLDDMNSRVAACGIKGFSGKWYVDSDFQTQLSAGKLTSRWEDNYYNYMVYTQIDEDLTPRFTEYTVRDSNNIYRFNSTHKDIFPVDTSSFSFSDELKNNSYSPYEVSKVYYVNKTTGLKQSEWQPGQTLQGKKLFVDLNSQWSQQKNIKFVNSVKKLYSEQGPSYSCDYVSGSGKIRDVYSSIFAETPSYLKIFKGSFLPSGELEWNKNKTYTADDSVNLYELIRIDTCITELKIYIIDANGTTENVTFLHDIAFETEEDTISEYDLGEIANDVFDEGYFPEYIENSTWIPKAYYRIKTSEAADLTGVEAWTPIQDSGYSYIQINKGCKIEKLNNAIYIKVEGTL